MTFEKVWESFSVPLLWAQWNLESNANILPEYLGVGYKNAAFVVKNWHCETFYEMENMVLESKAGFSLYTSPEKAHSLLKVMNEKSENRRIFATELCETDLSDHSIQQLLALFQEIYETIGDLFGLYNCTQPACFEHVRTYLISELEKLHVDDPIAAFLALSAPITPSSFTQAEMDWANIKNDEDLLQYYHRYRFLGADEGTIPPTIQELREKLKEPRNPVVFQNNIAEQEELIAQYAIPKKIVDLFTIVQEFTHARLDVRNAWVACEWTCAHILEALADQWKVSAKSLPNCTREEILSTNIPAGDVLESRRRFFVAYLEEGNFGFKVGQDAQEYVEKHRLFVDHSASQLTGQPASKGIVRGYVTVLRAQGSLASELAKMQEGNILIATMTKPMFMPAIKKAAAIVTDEGGITSHAAIIAREFGVPCVIGTKHATRAFEDGDLIEVDAEKGVVRKI